MNSFWHWSEVNESQGFDETSYTVRVNIGGQIDILQKNVCVV